jgi:hypothetical protein
MSQLQLLFCSTNEADHQDIIEILFESGFKHHNPYPIYIKIYYEFSLLHIFSLVIQPWMSAYIRKTDGVYMYVFGLAPKNNNNVVDKNRNIYSSLNQSHNTE